MDYEQKYKEAIAPANLKRVKPDVSEEEIIRLAKEGRLYIKED